MGLSKHLLFKVNSRNTRKKYEICPKLTINTKESRTGVFTVKCFYCWRWIGKRLFFLCKYYYARSKDEEILYLTLFKMAACLLNSKYLTTRPYSTYFHEKGFPAILLKLTMLQVRYKGFFSFFIDILPSVNLTFYSERLLLSFFIFYMV